MSNIKMSRKNDWFSHLEEISLPFQKFGSFLPEQLQLLERVYEKIENSRKRVWMFDSPPSSGKTHVICLLSRVFMESNNKTAIIVPSNYLKEDFRNACFDVRGGLPGIDILNLYEYLKTDRQYDYVLVDEAHNLKSFLELEGRTVKSLNFSLEDEFYSNFLSRYLPPERDFVAQQLSFSSVKDMLDVLKHIPEFRIRLKKILDDPTLWRCFLYIWKKNNLCILKFICLEGSVLKIPSKNLLLFSATQLSNEELSLYCRIPSEAVDRAKPVESSAQWRSEQKLCISITDSFSDSDKLSFLKSLVKESKTRTLVLFNSFPECAKAFEALKRDLNNSFIIPPRSKERPDIFERYLSQPNGVLFTSSTIFWEGVNVNGLKLLVIYSPPFPRPHFIELLGKRIYNGKTDMARRLEQGFGRIGRKKGETGIVIALFDIDKVGKGFNKMFTETTLIRTKSFASLLIVHKFFEEKSVSVKSAAQELSTS
jgi:hypothetical protein